MNHTPESWGGGISYEYDNRLFVEADYSYQKWSEVGYAKLEGFESMSNYSFDNRWKAALGAQFTPNQRGKYFSRVAYRLGAYYCHDYLNIEKMGSSNNVHEYGVSCGIGLPAPSSKTMINIGFEYKHRATSPVSLITENYFNFTLGVNFNQLWFWKNKID